MAVFGAMLFPGRDEAELREAHLAHYHRKPLREFHDDGGLVSAEHIRLLTNPGVDPREYDLHWDRGVAVGETVKVLFGLILNHPEYASWNNATRKVSEFRMKANESADAKQQEKAPASRKYLMEARAKLAGVEHLWGAYALRGYQLQSKPDIGYTIETDLHYFLLEAEKLRHTLASRIPDRAKAKPFLSTGGWRVPPEWEPPKQKPDWPEAAGEINHFSLDEELICGLKPVGRKKNRI